MTVEEYLQKIESLDFGPISSETWQTVQDEGIDEENDSFEETDFLEASLELSEEDSKGLLALEEESVEKFNVFDIELKTKFPDLVDLIDYDYGTVKIVKILRK